MESLFSKAKITMQLQADNDDHLKLAANILRNGGIVALPTETVYGLAASGLSSVAIAKVFAAKNRPLNNPLILHVNNSEQARELFDFSESPEGQKRFLLLAEAFWPGPLTIIAKKSANIPDEATGKLKSVAVRVPNNAATRAIMAMLDFPLVMPSANLSTRPSPTLASHVLKTLDGRIDAVVDDGACEVGIESTVVKIDGDVVTILRPGSIDKSMIEDCLREIVVGNNGRDHDEAQPISPGQSFLHYSPSVMSVALVDSSEIGQHWHSLDIVLAKRSDFEKMENRYGPRPQDAVNMILSDDPKQCAKELYYCLYACESSPDKRLIIVQPATEILAWHAIVDRLKRSAGA